MGNNKRNDNPKNNEDYFGHEGDLDSGVDTLPRITSPKMFKVVLLNDDFTPMDFVVLILKRYFAKTEEQATQVMLEVHQKGAGLAGVYTLEIGEMKVMQVNQFARQNQYPLKANLEEE